jgi:hypothetical protein
MWRPKSKGGMGFRDLKCFNKALLAKQRWRIIQNPDSLAGKIIKAKYFPRGSFLESGLGNKPFFAWRSIFGAIDLLQEGLIWRIGDGKKVKIWRDKWLNILTTYSIQTPRVLFLEDSKVSELIDQESKWWNRQLISSMFMTNEVEAILKISLSRYGHEDLIFWRGTNSEFLGSECLFYGEGED